MNKDIRGPMTVGDPVLWEPRCMVINCPLHKEAAPPGRRRSPTTRSTSSAVERGAPSPRRSKLEVANERNRKLLDSREVSK